MKKSDLKPNLKKIIEENLEKDKFQSKTQPSLPKGGWLDQYMNTGGTYISDRAQATQFGQYRLGGRMFPEYHSFAPPRMNYGGDISIADLDMYELAGTVRPKPILAPAATESTARSFHNPMLGAATNTATTGYRDNMAQTKKPITGTIPTMANNFGLGNPRDIMGRNTSSSTQAPPLYNPQQNRDIRVNSATGQKQVQTLMKAGQNKAAATYAVANKKFTGNQQKILNDRAALEHNVT